MRKFSKLNIGLVAICALVAMCACKSDSEPILMPEPEPDPKPAPTPDPDPVFDYDMSGEEEGNFYTYFQFVNETDKSLGVEFVKPNSDIGSGCELMAGESWVFASVDSNEFPAHERLFRNIVVKYSLVEGESRKRVTYWADLAPSDSPSPADKAQWEEIAIDDNSLLRRYVFDNEDIVYAENYVNDAVHIPNGQPYGTDFEYDMSGESDDYYYTYFQFVNTTDMIVGVSYMPFSSDMFGENRYIGGGRNDVFEESDVVDFPTIDTVCSAICMTFYGEDGKVEALYNVEDTLDAYPSPADRAQWDDVPIDNNSMIRRYTITQECYDYALAQK